MTSLESSDGQSDSGQSDEFVSGQLAERERFADYLAHFEKSSRAMAKAATSDDSRIYQTTLANTMKAMRQAIKGGFHWQDGWRSS
jgi:hypothetical protein